MCRLEGRSPGLGGVGTGSVRAVLMPAAVASSRQFETSPEEIEQEMRTAFCERRQTDLRQIIV